MNALFQPVSIGSILLKNRIVFAPTSVGRGERDLYRAVAAGGAGLIVLADLSVVPSMLGAPSLESMKDQEYLKAVIDDCHRYGCMVSAQLFHPEYDAEVMTALYHRNGASTPGEVRAKLAESTEHFCDELTTDRIEAITEAFAVAARNAKAIGFDMLQIHGDRLIGSFTSPAFNHRTDCYQDHFRFPVEVVRAVRGAALDMALDYKLTIRMEDGKLGKGGIAEQEAEYLVPLLEESGVDSFHVSLANHTAVSDTIPPAGHPGLTGEACFLPLARLVRQYSSKPVCAVGKIQRPETALAILNQGIDFIGMSRQLIADPCWPHKVESGRPETITYCLYCNRECVRSLQGGRSVGCSLHSGAQSERSNKTCISND